MHSLECCHYVVIMMSFIQQSNELKIYKYVKFECLDAETQDPRQAAAAGQLLPDAGDDLH